MPNPVKPCPFCGKGIVRVVSYHNAHGIPWKEGDIYGLVAICSATEGGCGASTAKCPDSEQAVEKWNTRQ